MCVLGNRADSPDRGRMDDKYRLNTEKRDLILWLNTIFYDLRIESILLDVNEN